MEKVKRHIIYMYEFPNGKKYIGATCQTLCRRQGKNWQRYKGCSNLWNAIQEFGYQNIKVTILEEREMTATEAGSIEKAYIKKYNTTTPEFGYNSYNGGDGVHERKLSKARREQLSEQMYAIAQNNKGRKASEDTRYKQSKAKLGIKRGPLSEETKRKISIANSRENMSEETKMRRHRAHLKMVSVTNPETNEVYYFEGLEPVADYFGVRVSTVSRWISGDRNPSNHFVFSFYTPTTTE